jgi:hypothetical protein
MQYTHTAVLRLMVADLALSLLLSQSWDGLVRWARSSRRACLIQGRDPKPEALPIIIIVIIIT